VSGLVKSIVLTPYSNTSRGFCCTNRHKAHGCSDSGFHLICLLDCVYFLKANLAVAHTAHQLASAMISALQTTFLDSVSARCSMRGKLLFTDSLWNR
jgi:hypothetical protein